MIDRVLITGSTGFVGKQVLKVLQKTDVEIILVVRPGWEKKILNQIGIVQVFETEDLFAETSGWWADACRGVDKIIHLAWYAEPGKGFLSDKHIDCLQGTLNLAKGAVTAAVKMFVGMGTCYEYDLTSGILSPATPVRPLTPYAAAKAATYFSLMNWLMQHNIKFAWCRLFNLYGEGDAGNRLVAYIRNCLENNQVAELTSGKQVRDFIDVLDAAKMITDVVLNERQGVVNVCSGVPITVRQLAEQVADEYGKRDLLEFNARPDNIVDPICIIGVKV